MPSHGAKLYEKRRSEHGYWIGIFYFLCTVHCLHMQSAPNSHGFKEKTEITYLAQGHRILSLSLVYWSRIMRGKNDKNAHTGILKYRKGNCFCTF